LTFGDVKDRSLRIEVIEDDADRCPVAANLDPDDLLGTELLDGIELFTPYVMRFDRVIHLNLGREQ
jgi:hypothetical protein